MNLDCSQPEIWFKLGSKANFRVGTAEQATMNPEKHQYFVVTFPVVFPPGQCYQHYSI
jgi:hypothetical protein